MCSLGTDLSKNGSVLCNGDLSRTPLSFPSCLFSGLLAWLLHHVLLKMLWGCKCLRLEA